MVKKAIIPAAGFGTRLFPTTKVFKKEFFPIIDTDGRAKPVILLIIEEFINSGIEEIGIIIQKSDQAIFEKFFKQLPAPNLLAKLSPENQAYSTYLEEIGKKVTFIYQEQPEGFGNAVYCARDWIGDDYFLLSLGDHVYKSHSNISCSQQLINIQEKYQTSCISLTIMSANIIHKAGVITGNWQEKNSLISITELAEKPTLDYARSHLHLKEMDKEEFLAVFGLYILSPQIFKHLENEQENNYRYRGEFQLTTSLNKLCQEEEMIGYLIQGQYFDTGMPEFYRQTIIDFNC